MRLLPGGEMMKKKAFWMTLIVAVLLPFAVLAAQVGTFTAVNGRVDIAGVDKVARLVKVGDPVDEGDVVRTKSNSRAEITFTDDNILRMAERSRVVISEYVSSDESLTAKLTLSRGKVQNIVRKTGRILGRLKKNRFEVHTPTAVVGVRGTNFFTYFQRGISGAAFLEGEGYGYNPNMPDQVEFVTAGQALLIMSADAVPVTKDASDPDMDRHIQDTAPQGDDDGDEGDGGDGDGQGGEDQGRKDKGGDSAKSKARKKEAAAVNGSGKDLGKVPEGEADSGVIPPLPVLKKIITTQPSVVNTLPADVQQNIVSTLPVAELTTFPNRVSNDETPVFEINPVVASALTAGGYKVGYNLDGSGWTELETRSFEVFDPFTGGPLSEGLHQIQFVVIDANGNRSSEKVYEWRTDYTDPEVYLSNTPPALTNADSGTIVVSSSEAVTYTYRLDGIQVNSPTLSGLSEGPHTFEVLATDDAGNTGTAPPYTWTTDYTPPDVLVAAQSIAQPGPGGADVDVTLGANATDVADYTWSLDNGAQTGTGSTVNLAALADGTHTLTYKSIDDAGNESDAGTLTFELYNQGFSGTVAGTGSVLTGTSEGAFSAVLNESWGNWKTVASGTYTGTHSAGWHAVTGGELSDGSSHQIGNWIEKIDGVTSISSLTALTKKNYITGTGTVAATFTPTTTDAGDWELTDTGSGDLTETPLVLSGWWDDVVFDVFQTGLLYNNGGLLGRGGYVDGYIGLTGPLTGPADFHAMGDFWDNMGAAGYLWNNEISGRDIATDGADSEFIGFTAGIFKDEVMDGATVGLYNTPAAIGSFIGNVAGEYYPGIDMWMADGVVTPSAMAPPVQIVDFRDENYIARMSQTYPDDSYIVGAGYSISAFFNDGGVAEPWGIYNLQVGEDLNYDGIWWNEYYTVSGVPVDLSGRAVDVGGVSNGTNAGIWIGSVENTTWADGEIRGDLIGNYLTESEMGTLGGPFFGLYDLPDVDGYGEWIGAGVGTYEGTPLTFSGFADGSLMYADTTQGVWLAEGGHVEGLVGGLQNPLQQGAPGSITMMGFSYDGMDAGFDPQGAYLMYGSGVDIAGVIGADFTEGAFYGYFVGNWRNGEIDGRLASIYINQDQDAGLLTDSRTATLQIDGNGNVTVNPAAVGIPGAYYPHIEMWEVEGDTIAGPVIGTTTMTAGDLASDPFYALTPTHFSGDGGGDFTGGGFLHADFVEGDPLRLDDQEWGIWNMGVGGWYDTYDGSVSDSWQVSMGGDYDGSGYWLGLITGTSWGDPDISGTYSGIASTEEASSRFIGEILGTQQVDMYGGTWQAAGIGTYELVPNAFSSFFKGGLFVQEPGTSYSGDFDRWNPTEGFHDAYYDYEYFISQSGTLRFGSYYMDDNTGNREGRVFAPDGTVFDTTDYFARYYSSWTPGTLTEADFNDPLARTWPTNPAGSTWDRQWYDEWSSNLALETGNFDGLFYGPDDLWTATSGNPAPFHILGTYYNDNYNNSGPYLFTTTLASSGVSGGAFAGGFGGVLDEMAGKLTGAFYGLYVAPDNSAGILEGIIDYNSNDNFLVPELGMYLTEGTLFPTRMTAASGLTPADFQANLDGGVAGSWLTGGFGSQDSWFGSSLGIGKTMSLRGHNDWGVFNMIFGWDNYLVNPVGASAAIATVGGLADFGTHAAGGASPVVPDSGIFMTDLFAVSLDLPTTGMLGAEITGEYLTYTQMGDLAGQLLGTYDGVGSWQGIAGGHWLNGRPLSFNGDVDGGLFRTVEDVSGYYDNSAGTYPDPATVFYSYSYETGIDRGWSREEDTSAGIIISKSYNPDGTVDIWTDDNGTLTYASSTFTPGTLDAELTGWSPPDGGSLPVETPVVHLYEMGHFSAILGSVDDLWTADSTTPATTHLIGEISEDFLGTGESALINARVGSVNPYHENNTIWDQSDQANPVDGNGAYMGLLSGLTRSDNSIDLTMQGIYLDPAGNIGIVTGDVGGSADTLSGMWRGDGTLYPIEFISDTSFAPSQLYQIDGQGGIVMETREMNIFDGQTAGGWFIDYSQTPPAAGSSIGWTDYNYTQLTVADSPAWSVVVQSAQYGGSYDNSMMSDHWISMYEVMDMSGGLFIGIGMSAPNPAGWDGSEVGSVDTEGQWSNGVISGKGAGAWVSIDTAMTGVAGADLKGTFNPTNTTWQMAAAWAGMDTATFLELAATQAGREKLGQLNIPCIEVGRTSLSGSDTVFSDVHINDATFFAYSTNAAPTLWGSGDAGGAYVSLPGQGHTVKLTGAEGLSADFMVNNWGTGTWDASITGGGNYTGSGTMNGSQISFAGGAAGSYTPGTGTTGTFSGTASGTVMAGGETIVVP
jgi:hypothetical protein